MSYPAKGRADYYAPGDWNVRCWECGGKYKASELVQHWQGYFVCVRCYEPRQPQDFVAGTQDVQTVPWSQPQTDTFALVCDLPSRSCFAGAAVAGCAIAGFTPNIFEALASWVA